jgi:hypothetical protein
MKEIDKLLIREPFKTVDPHDDSFALRLLNLLSQPLKRLDTLITRGKNIDAGLGRHSTYALKPSP